MAETMKNTAAGETRLLKQSPAFSAQRKAPASSLTVACKKAQVVFCSNTVAEHVVQYPSLRNTGTSPATTAGNAIAGMGPGPSRLLQTKSSATLRLVSLQLDLTASLFDLCLQLLRILFGQTFFQRLGSTFHEFLGLFQTQPGCATHNFDHSNLLC